MDIIILILEILILIAIGLIALVWKKTLSSYLIEKGKNLATKEDIEVITKTVESVKFTYTNEEKILERKRQIYEEIVISLKIFISGHDTSNEKKEKFYETYASAWLWAPDSVLLKLNFFVEEQIKHAEGLKIITQESMKEQYGDIVVEMRKDVGFKGTEATSKNYLFATFGK